MIDQQAVRLAEQQFQLTGAYGLNEVKSAHRRLLKESHPDVVAARGGDVAAATEETRRINAMAEILAKHIANSGGRAVAGVNADTEPAPSRPAPAPEQPKPTGESQQESENFDTDDHETTRPEEPSSDQPSTASPSDDPFAHPGKESRLKSVLHAVVIHFPWRLALLCLGVAVFGLYCSAYQSNPFSKDIESFFSNFGRILLAFAFLIYTITNIVTEHASYRLWGSLLDLIDDPGPRSILGLLTQNWLLIAFIATLTFLHVTP